MKKRALCPLSGVHLTIKPKRFVDFIFGSDNIKSISLTVFDFNQRAKRIYEKVGFEINEVIEAPKLKYIMKRYR